MNILFQSGVPCYHFSLALQTYTSVHSSLNTIFADDLLATVPPVHCCGTHLGQGLPVVNPVRSKNPPGSDKFTDESTKCVLHFMLRGCACSLKRSDIHAADLHLVLGGEWHDLQNLPPLIVNWIGFINWPHFWYIPKWYGQNRFCFWMPTLFSPLITAQNAIVKHPASQKALRNVSMDLKLHRMCEISLCPQELSNLYGVVPNLSENSCGFHSAS